MRKHGIAFVIAILLTSFQLFSATEDFTISSMVNEVGLMKVSSSAVTADTLVAFNDSGDLTTYEVLAGGNQTSFQAYLTTISNKRAGYSVAMTATAMESTESGKTAYINYSVTCNGIKVTTNNAKVIASKTVVTKTNITGLTALSWPIILKVTANSYNKAVAGTYVGTVTFTFTAT